jgi:penicillin-binding protein 1A
LEATWESYAPRTVMRGPSPEAQRQLVAFPINLASGERVSDKNSNAFVEYFRTDGTGRVAETQHRLIARGDVGEDDDVLGNRAAYAPQNQFNPFGLFGRIFQPQVAQPLEERLPSRTRRVGPDYFFGN